MCGGRYAFIVASKHFSFLYTRAINFNGNEGHKFMQRLCCIITAIIMLSVMCDSKKAMILHHFLVHY